MYHTICRCIHQTHGQAARVFAGSAASAAVSWSIGTGRNAPFSASPALGRGKRSQRHLEDGQGDLPDVLDGFPTERIPTGQQHVDKHHIRDLLKSIESSANVGSWPHSPALDLPPIASGARDHYLRSKYLRNQGDYEQPLDLADHDSVDNDGHDDKPSRTGRHKRSRSRPPSDAGGPDKEPALSLSGRRRTNPTRPIPLADLLASWHALENILGKATAVGLSESDARKVMRAFSASLRAASSSIPAATHPRDVPATHTKLNHLWIQFLAKYVPQDQKPLFTALCESADLRHPKEWYPGARLMKRQIVLHVGPTNSGKTHGALAELAQSTSGVYCGPLRLLAHEIHDRFTAGGTACSLVTGEERRVDPLARITACTVEMVDLGREYDVGVIDEIQVIGDGQRGWAWTQALLGLRARRIYVCGEEAAVPLVKRLLEGTGDEVVVKRFDRLTPLKVSEGVVKGKLKGVRPGDCVVAFSRKEVFAYKVMIERENPGLKCAVVYGALPPETRAEQARLFNNHRETGYGVMVATDAVGMGLNLAINRVIFTTTRKYDGSSETPLSISALKQIGGRAGRFGLAHATAYGTVTAFRERDLRYIHETFPQSPPELTSAGLQPTPEMIEAFAHQLPHEPLTGLLDKFAALARLNGEMYFLCNLDDQRTLAHRIQDVRGMSMREQYLFVLAPVNTRSEVALEAFYRIADKFARCQGLPLMSLLLPGVAVKGGQGQRMGEWRLVFNEAVLRGIKAPPKSTREVRDARAVHVLSELYSCAQQETAMTGQVLDEWQPSRVFAPATSRDQLALLESVHRGILLYMWLTNRFEGHATFMATPRAQAEWLLRECERAINLGLKVITERDYIKLTREEEEVGQVPAALRWGVTKSSTHRKRERVETEESRVVIEEV